jgi:TP901 family phage tail tape measure protein
MELFKLLGTIAITNEDANNAIDETTGKAEKSEGKMSSAFKKIGAAVATYFSAKAIVDFGAACVSTTASFEDAMLKVQSLSGATKDEYQKLTDAALEYGSTTAWTSKDVADAMGYMALAGFDTNEILKSTSGMLSLASASGEQLATVTDILTDSMTAFGDGADQASRYADVLATTQAKSNTTVGLLGEAFKYVAPLAGSYKYELEDVSTALGMMANAGVKGSMAGTSLSSIITRLGTDTDGCRETIEALGVEFYNSDGSARNLSDVLIDLSDATKDMDVAQKSALAKTVAGQEAQKGLLAILNQGSDAYKELNKQIREVGASTESEAKAMADNMESGIGGAIRSIQSAWEGFQIKIGQKLQVAAEPAIRRLASFVTDKAIPAVDTISEKVESFSESANEFLSPLIDAFRNLGGAISADAESSTFLQDAFSGAAAIIGNVWNTVGQPVFDALVSGINWLADNWGPISDAVSESFSTMMEIMSTVWNNIGKPVWDMIFFVISEVAGMFQRHMPEIMKFFNEAAAGIKDTWDKHLKPALKAIGDMLRNDVMPAFEFVFKTIIEPLIETVFQTIGRLWNGTLKPIFDGIIDFLAGTFTGDWKRAFTGILNIVTGIFNAILTAIETPMNHAKNVVNRAIEYIKEKFNFEWSLPQLKLPHFSISGSFSLNPPSVPSFGIEWYKKAMNDPVIMNSPTAFGINKNGQIMAGGEAGSEVVSGKDTLLQLISQAVSEKNQEIIDAINRLLEFLMMYIPELAGMKVVLDSGALVGELAPEMDEELGRLATKNGRRI